MAESARINGSDISYEVARRNVKYPRLEFKTGELLLVLPEDFRSHEDIVERHKEWIYEKHSLIESAIKDARKEDLDLDRTSEEFKKLVQNLVGDISEQLGLNTGKIYFKKMKSKWASCSQKRNLTVNTLLRYLPEGMIEYVIFHEMTHMIERSHNERFWHIVSQRFCDFQEREDKLLTYWFLLQFHLIKG